MDDVQKRSEYRKAHGIGQEEGVLGGWTAKSDAQLMGPALREGGSPESAVEAMDASPIAAAEAPPEGMFVDFEGKLQPLPRKKWFGIW